MSIKVTEGIQNARLDAMETTIGTGPTLEIRSGAPPASAGDADSGTLLASITLPSDWMAAASGGSKSKLGTWEDPVADASGTAGHFRIKKGGQVLQGTVTATGGGGDLTVDNTTIGAGDIVRITGFTLNDGNG